MLFGNEHVERYEATDGEEGHDWRGTTTLILTTRGRRSGEPRKAPLIYQPYGDGDDVLIVASLGGAPRSPSWYFNLSENPEVEVQIRGEHYKAHARTATAQEKPDMWRTMAATWPDYDEYQKKTERDIPVVVLERL
jgi:deazaflavin-dependent oxidoreductase (nitroreductase family)